MLGSPEEVVGAMNERERWNYDHRWEYRQAMFKAFLITWAAYFAIAAVVVVVIWFVALLLLGLTGSVILLWQQIR